MPRLTRHWHGFCPVCWVWFSELRSFSSPRSLGPCRGVPFFAAGRPELGVTSSFPLLAKLLSVPRLGASLRLSSPGGRFLGGSFCWHLGPPVCWTVPCLGVRVRRVLSCLYLGSVPLALWVHLSFGQAHALWGALWGAGLLYGLLAHGFRLSSGRLVPWLF